MACLYWFQGWQGPGNYNSRPMRLVAAGDAYPAGGVRRALLSHPQYKAGWRDPICATMAYSSTHRSLGYSGSLQCWTAVSRRLDAFADYQAFAR